MRRYKARKPYPVCRVHDMPLGVYCSKRTASVRIQYFRCRVDGCEVRDKRCETLQVDTTSVVS